MHIKNSKERSAIERFKRQSNQASRRESDEDAEAVDIDANKLQKSPGRRGKNLVQSQNSSNFGSTKNLRAHMQSSEMKPMAEPNEN
jgi:hypothetical protein